MISSHQYFLARQPSPPVTRVRRGRQHNAGYTLLELVVATFIAGAILVPSLKLMRESLVTGRKIENRQTMTTLCSGKVEEYVGRCASDFRDRNDRGSFQSAGHRDLRYQVVCSQSPANGGLTSQLMAVVATVWEETNRNGALDPGEPRVVLATKIAKLKNYQQP